MTAVEKILQEVKKIDVDDRVLLAHDIWKSVEAEIDGAELTEEQKAELLRRQREHLKDPGNVVSWAEVKRQMKPAKR